MKEIEKALKKIERDYNVKIVWAIESGSRAWGFASDDSDYDIRCMHIGKVKDYLGMFQPPQQINLMEGNLDIESWDIKKFAALTMKSNPQIAEWLRSPIVYRESDARERLRDLFDKGCSLEFLSQHYLRMAKQNYRKYMGIGSEHSCKKYLYVLRGIACSEFIKKEKKLPPLPYKEVIPYLPKSIEKFFEKCVIQKNQTEKATIIASPEVSLFIDKKISEIKPKKRHEFSKIKELNEFVVKQILRRG